MKIKKKTIMLIIISILTILILVQFANDTYAFNLLDMKNKAYKFEEAGQGEADKILPIEGSRSV